MSDADAKEVREPKLPVWRIVTDSYRILFGNFGTYLRLSWFPFLVVVLGTAALKFYDRAFGVEGDTFSSLAFAGSFLISEILWFVTIPVATAWSRFIILGRDRPDARISYSIGREELDYLWRYAYLGLLLYLIVVVPLWVFVELESIWFGDEQSDDWFGVKLLWASLSLVVTIWILFRLSLVLPAASIGARLRFRDSWKRTRRHNSRIFLILCAAYLPDLLGTITVVWLAPEPQFGPDDGIGEALLIGVGAYSFAWLFFTLAVTSLALIYKQLVAPSHSEPGGAAAP